MTTPVNVVTGFLGSGKTTLIARLLQDPELADTAVIVNEFGEVGLDHALVEPVRGDVVLLAQGCLCCALNGDLATTLESLDSKRAAAVVPNFDRVIVETTGVADPAPVLQTILDRPMLLCGYRLGHVVTTVDAVAGAITLDRHWEAVRQAAVADRLLVTKTDLAGGQRSDSLRRRLSLLNPTAPIRCVSHGEIEVEALFGNENRLVSAQPPPVSGEFARADATPATEHTHRMATVALEFPNPLPYEGLRQWLGDLVGAQGDKLLRVKGIIAVHGQDRPILVNGVQHLFHPPQQLQAWPVGLAKSTLVFILDGLEPAIVVESAVCAGLLPNDSATTASDRVGASHDHR
jgi:G3E family GTPase